MISRAVIGIGICGAAVAACLLANGAARAQPAFKKLFDEKYMKEGTPLFKAYGGRSNCSVCHIGDGRINRTPYGKALARRLDRADADALAPSRKVKNPEAAKKAEAKVKAALEAVEKERSDPKDPKSPTFGELIKTGTLPKSPTTLPEELKE